MRYKNSLNTPVLLLLQQTAKTGCPRTWVRLMQEYHNCFNLMWSSDRFKKRPYMVKILEIRICMFYLIVKLTQRGKGTWTRPAAIRISLSRVTTTLSYGTERALVIPPCINVTHQNSVGVKDWERERLSNLYSNKLKL